MQTFNHKTITPGTHYCECLGHRYFYEDSAEFLGWLTAIYSSEAILNQIGFIEREHGYD